MVLDVSTENMHKRRSLDGSIQEQALPIPVQMFLWRQLRYTRATCLEIISPCSIRYLRNFTIWLEWKISVIEEKYPDYMMIRNSKNIIHQKGC